MPDGLLVMLLLETLMLKGNFFSVYRPASGSPRARSSSMSSARPQRPPPPNANRPKAAEK